MSGRRSSKKNGAAEGLLVVLLGLLCLALAMCALIPALAALAWIWWEVRMAAWPGLALLGPKDLTRSDAFDAIARQEKQDRAERRLAGLRTKSYRFERRSDGRLDERYRNARSLNYHIDAAEHELSAAILCTDEMQRWPLRAWADWARGFRYLWAFRLTVTVAAVGTVVGLRKGWWNPMAFVREWATAGIPDITQDAAWIVVACAAASILATSMGWKVGGHVAASRIARNMAAETSGRAFSLGARLAGGLGFGCAALSVMIAIVAFAATPTSSPITAAAPGSAVAASADLVPVTSASEPGRSPQRRRRRARHADKRELALESRADSSGESMPLQAELKDSASVDGGAP